MTAAEFAELVQARPTGRGRWQAKCPAHVDRSPSLSIQDGADGRVLFLCRAGCEPLSVLQSLGLGWRDLFNDSPVDPRDIAKARAERVASEAAAHERGQIERRAGDIYRRLAIVVDDLAARLARSPAGSGGDALAATFHWACELRCEVETLLGCYGAAPTMEPAESTPNWSPFEPSPETLEAARVCTKGQLVSFIGTGLAGP